MNMLCKLPVVPIYKGEVMEDQLLLGQSCTILNTAGKFYLIETQYGYCGYIKKTALTKNKEFCSLEKLVIKASFAVIFTSPSLKSPSLCTLPKGAIIGVISYRQDSYAKVMLPSGRLGYCKYYLTATCESPYKKSESTLRTNICENALSYLGCEYLWGGKTPLGIDCSGLAFMAYYLEGITIYRDAVLKNGFQPIAIEPQNAKKGDLLYFKGHIAIYLGKDRFVHSTAFAGREGVGIASLNPCHKEYRADLKSSLYAAASVF